jgi:Uma2 family endonuclease
MSDQKEESDIPPSQLAIMKKIKFEDYLEAAPENKCDLVDGNYIIHSPASFRHVELRQFLVIIIALFIEKYELGKLFSENFPIKLNDKNWREPDIAFVSQKNLDKIHQNVFTGAPDFIIEIISEDSRYRDEVRKRAEYERLGVGEYWILDPESYTQSTFLKLKKSKYIEIEFKSGKLETSNIPDLYFKSEWIWSGKELPNILNIIKELGIV